MKPRTALATLTETRSDFRQVRQHLVEEETAKLSWIQQETDLLTSEPIYCKKQVSSFVRRVENFGAESLIIHIPIWSEPVLTVSFSDISKLPVLLLGNTRAETSSIVGVLGAGGALNQVGIDHLRVFDQLKRESQLKLKAFIRASAAVKRLRGRTMGLFGSRSLGIMTATASSSQWHRIFGIDMEPVDQLLIIQEAEKLEQAEVKRYLSWLEENVSGIEYGGLFDEKILERQVRSYLATRKIVRERGYDFVGVKCQPELSDGYTTQCISHMLTNGTRDIKGEKAPIVHACEADADGALTMEILRLLSGGKTTALLDIRWFDRENSCWTLANCGALPAEFAAGGDKNGMAEIKIIPHVFGKAGACALQMVVAPQEVTLARLCRKEGSYWMAIVRGKTEERSLKELKKTTAAFPQAFVKTSAGDDFLNEFGSNHIHMVQGNYSRELVEFCRQTGLNWRLWD